MQSAVLNCRTHIYRRREPEKVVLYQAIADNLETFLERLRAEGHELPKYVVEEFYRYLDCGILAHGFARCACESCGKSFAVAFSCKGRAFCSSCMGRRMGRYRRAPGGQRLPRCAGEAVGAQPSLRDQVSHVLRQAPHLGCARRVSARRARLVQTQGRGIGVLLRAGRFGIFRAKIRLQPQSGPACMPRGE
jgi:hypothetical protein